MMDAQLQLVQAAAFGIGLIERACSQARGEDPALYDGHLIDSIDAAVKRVFEPIAVPQADGDSGDQSAENQPEVPRG